jgi:hypothetical protein
MASTMNVTENVAEEIKTGRPERYYDYVYQTHGDAFRSGSVESLQIFAELYRQVLSLRNERSTRLFIERFVPLIPKEARRKIAEEFSRELEAMKRRSSEENVTRANELLRKKKPSG